MPSDPSLQLEDITGDLVRVLEVVQELRDIDGSATYETVRRATNGEFNLHLLSYVRFLESNSLLTYDRISDEMEVTSDGDRICKDPSEIVDETRAAFSEQLGELGSHDLGDVFDGVAEGMDDALDEFDAGQSTQRIDAGEQAFAMGDGGGVSFGATGDEVAPPPAAGGGVEPSTQKLNQAASTNGAPTSLPTEENSMNGDIDTPEAKPQWSQSGQESSIDQSAYERIEEIGSGGIGTVYRGRQVRLNRDVAIKEIREIFNVFAGIQRSDILARFQSIAETQASLVHPNVIQLVDVDTSGEYPFSVMQLAPNGNLRRLLEQGDRPPLKVSLKYFLQMLHALNVAHDQGIIHGSLKPENVVLDHAGNALMTDFGIAKIVEHDGGAGNQVYVGVGSVAYMSPEQFQDPNLATVSTDIYSLGIMFYEMLTGKVPGRRSPMPSSFYPDIPRALDDIFDRMTMDMEEDRYDSIEGIISDLYDAEEIMELLDKRSGVLFLRDPITHGEHGLIGGSVAAGGETSADDEGEDESIAEGSDVDADVDEEEISDEGADDEEENLEESEESDSEPDDESGDESEEDEVLEEGDGGDVLNKLDEYGEMFDED